MEAYHRADAGAGASRVTADPPCVGCGCCCKKVPCLWGLWLYNSEVAPCVGLRWDAALRRYFCGAMLDAAEADLEALKIKLLIGTGCPNRMA